MPLIKPRTRRIQVFRHICRLQQPNRDSLLAYAKFINESPDYVLNQLIETTLARDRDFLAWRNDQVPGALPADDATSAPPSAANTTPGASR